MSQFFAAAFGFPTVILTPLLAVVVLYWVVVLFGGFDVEDGGALDFLGLGGMPAPVTLSLLTVLAWFACLSGTELFGAVPALLVLAGALVLAWAVVRLVVAAWARMVPPAAEPSRSDFLGLTCVIRTGSVTTIFGQAEVHAPDGSSALVQVRQTGADDLRAGTVAVLYDMDADGDFFWVVPADIANQKQ